MFIMTEPRKKQEIATEAAFKFMSIVSDDILLEIFLRLPNYRSVIQSSLVCKRWFSLIFNSKNFDPNFNHHHREKRQLLSPNSHSSHSFLPYTLLLRSSTHHSSLGKLFTPHDLFSKKSKILHGQRHLSPWFPPFCATTYLDFLGWPNATIRSSFDDLLLVEGTRKYFYICNPLTRQWVPLPLAPNLGGGDQKCSCGLVCDTNSDCNNHQQLGSYYCNCNIKYRVVLINYHKAILYTAIFSSETGQWNKSSFKYPYFDCCGSAIACNGILYWTNLYNRTWQKILAFDPFKEIEVSGKERCRLISLPESVFIIAHNRELVITRFGVVQGRLRL